MDDGESIDVNNRWNGPAVASIAVLTLAGLLFAYISGAAGSKSSGSLGVLMALLVYLSGFLAILRPMGEGYKGRQLIWIPITVCILLTFRIVVYMKH